MKDGAGIRDPEAAVLELVRNNPGQGSFDEYLYLLETIRSRAPCNLLVFGVGRDSTLWIEGNTGGRTTFLEHVPDWIELAREAEPDVEVHRVEYDTRRFQWRWLLRKPDRLLMKDLPDDVLATAWDLIFVDAPGGDRWKRPGRMKSIYTAAVLARRSRNAEVFVHDCDRKIERVYADRFLGDERLVRQVDTLRHYRLAPGSDARPDHDAGRPARSP